MSTAAELLAAYQVKEVQTWDKQAWDTPTSFARFRSFYLPQTRPRSLNRAYRLWRKSEGQEVVPNATAPRRWRYWTAGAKGPGPKLDGSTTWHERAIDYDRYMLLITQAAKEQWAWKVAEDDYTDGANLRKFARSILEQGPEFIKANRKLIRGKSKTITGQDGEVYLVQEERDREVITLALDWQALVRALETSSRLQRLAADVSDPISRHALVGDEDKKAMPADMLIAALRQAQSELDENDE